MNLAAVAPTPLPIMSTTGPQDWAGVPLATIDWDDTTNVTFATGGGKGITKVDGATTLEQAITAASRRSYDVNSSLTSATAVLQAKDGAFYITRLADHDSTNPKDGYVFPAVSRSTRVKSVTPHVDALRAVVGGTTWVKFDTVAGSAPTSVDLAAG